MKLERIVSIFVMPIVLLSTAKGQEAEKPLVDSVLTILKGNPLPPRSVEIEERLTTVPEGCRFTFALPPGKQALQWRQLGRPVFHRADGTCEAAFEVGTPARFSRPEMDKDRHAGTRQAGPTVSKGYFKMWWVDPVGLT